MSLITLDDLRVLLDEAAGECDFGSDVAHSTFSELGYDSLAVMETAALLRRRYGVVIPEEVLAELDTPVALLAFVNSVVAA